MDEKKSLFGLNENLASVFAYIIPPITGLLALILEKDNKKVRFNGMQSFIYFLALWILRIIVGIFPFFIGDLLETAVAILFAISWIYLILMSYKGIIFKIPIIGEVCYNQIYK